MTKTIKSQTRDTHYFLTIDEDGLAHDCSCPDQHYRCHVAGNTAHTCKHMRLFNAAYERAVAFAHLFGRFDCRANGDEDTRRCYWELSLAS